ncbi:MAG: FecR family protein [Myxococcales bacterium]
MAAAAAVGGVVVWAALPQPPVADDSRHVAIGSDVTLDVSRNAAFDVLASSGDTTRQVILLSGSLRAKVGKQQEGSRFAVITPHVRVVVVGTRFSVEVLPERTLVDVTEGRVRVEPAQGESVEVASGEQLLSTDPRLARAAPSLASGGSPSTTCDASPEGPSRLECYRQMARGEGLAAENAVYLLGLAAEKSGDVDGALDRFGELARRFPSGALGPEAGLASCGYW